MPPASGAGGGRAGGGCLAWGVWADGVRTLAERRLGVSAAEGFAVQDDPGYARALRMGAWFDQAAGAAGTALEAAGDAGAGLLPVCRPVRQKQ